LQFIMSMDKLIEEVRKMTTDTHLKGSRGSHNWTREDARENDVKRMSQRRFDREVTELKERLSKVTELLHEEATGGQCYEWKLKRKVQWLVKRLCARNLKPKLSVWVKEEERLRATRYEEEVHIMCEPEQGVYLDGKGEDGDTEFTDKLMNRVRSSYPCNKEEGNVEERSTEDLKGCFAETEQHGRMEEKASVETEVPYVFKANDMCLTAGCTSRTKGQLLNIVQKFEEDEDEGKIMDMWNVYVLNIYLLTLLQVL